MIIIFGGRSEFTEIVEKIYFFKVLIYSHKKHLAFFAGPACIKYKDIFLEPMLSGLTCGESEVRQAASYGCGVLAQFGGEQFAPACARALPLLAALIAEPDSRSVENVNATENAISAVTKIIKYNHSQINRDEIIRHW